MRLKVILFVRKEKEKEMERLSTMRTLYACHSSSVIAKTKNNGEIEIHYQIAAWIRQSYQNRNRKDEFKTFY